MSAAAQFVGKSHPYLHTDEVADLLNKAAGKNVWDARKVRRWLQKAQALVKRGGSWVTTRAKLREAFPEVWEELVLQVGSGEED